MKMEEACRKEALAYLGCRDNPPPELAAQVEWGLSEVEKMAPPRIIWREFPLERSGENLTLSGTVLTLPGKDLEDLLRECGRAVLLAVTMGREAETAIRRVQVRDVGKGLVLDCCISAAVEMACNQWQAQMEKEASTRGEYLTDRFSPGYGDLPLSLQKDFLEVLDASRKIGLCATPEFLLTPRKSVTAVLGIAKTPQPRRFGGCAECPRYADCQLRKDGITCGK